MFATLRDWLSSDFFMPHGHCYLWQPAMVWLQVISNGAIALAYIAISATLAYLVHRLRDEIPFRRMYLAFGAFIVLCGVTHLFDIYVIWSPVYWLDGAVRVATAAVSVITAVSLPVLIPNARTLARGARAVRDRGVALETAVRDLETMYQKSRELDELKSQFFANVSHELRTPLTLVIGPVEKLLATTSLTSGQQRDLELVLRNARLLHRHVSDLLDAARLDAGKLALDYVTADLGHVVRLVAGNFEGLATDRGIRYLIDVAPAQAQIDPDKIERVVLNLLSNAFKVTPAGGQIRVALTVDVTGRAATLTVADSGPGIRPEHRDIVFERFRQLDGSATRREAGTGLGLSIVHDFVALHRGGIRIDDAPEGGAAFVIELPLDAPADARVRTVASDAARSEASALARQAIDELRVRVDARPSTRGHDLPLVLVVEDNAEMSRFVCDVLASDARTLTARDGAEGGALAVEHRPDLILTDLMMPNVSGDQLVRNVRANHDLDRIPIVLLTAKADDDLRVQLLREGAQDYITKPFSAEELRARVANLVTLKRAQDVLDEAKVAAETARHELETFSYSVSHDLRAPLRGMDGFSQILLEDYGDRLDPTGVNYLQRIRASARRMSELIDGLLELARVSRVDVVARMVELGPIAEAIVDELAAAEPDAARPEVLIEPGLIGHGDPRMLRQILQNLVGNAWKFSRRAERPRIEIGSASAGDGRARAFFVRDNGVGFSMDDADKLFEPFQRLHDESEFPGTGVGLATVYRIIARHGGRIWADSAPGQGATFWFTLPAPVERTPSRDPVSALA